MPGSVKTPTGTDIEPRKHERHETDGCETALLPFILCRVCVAFNVGSRSSLPP